MSQTTQHRAIVTHNPDGSKTVQLGTPVGWEPQPAPQNCTKMSDCPGGACARPYAGAAQLVCCPSGKRHLFAGKYYCTEMPYGAACYSDAMCSSGDCRDNHSGFAKGTCGLPQPNGTICDKNTDCTSGYCQGSRVWPQRSGVCANRT